MVEIGGYIELDTNRLPMLHENAIKLNCGRNALWYLIKARGIRKVWMPKFMCDSCEGVLKKENVAVTYYSIGMDFKPIDVYPTSDEWLYIVNYYGQLSNDYLSALKEQYTNLIVDNAQAYFQTPINGVDTLYTCRKFFGVADGAVLYTEVVLNEDLLRDESFERMHFLMGRFERTASEFYSEYVANNRLLSEEPIKRMSKLTENLLHGIDYGFVKQRRKENFAFLHRTMEKRNRLALWVPEGAFMYPLYLDNGAELRKKLQKMKIYIPTLWPAVFDRCRDEEPEADMARNILPLPVDQRYGKDAMQVIINAIEMC